MPPTHDPFLDGLPTLRGDRLVLRSLVSSDRREVFELYADKDAVRFGFAPKMDTLEDADALIVETAELARKRTVFHWGVAGDTDDRILGHATLFHLEPKHGRVEIGYSVRRDRWGRGIGGRAARVLIAFAFETLGLRRIEADVDPRNTASLRLLERHGFVREGYLRERWSIQGEIQDGVFLGLLRSDWERARSA